MAQRSFVGSRRRSSSLFRVGDKVMVMAGGNKHKNPLKAQVGKIVRFSGVDRVVVEGVNQRVRVVKAEGSAGKAYLGRVEAPLHLSNVMYFVEELSRPVRLRVQIRGDGVKVRGYSHPSSREFVEISVK